MRGLMTLNAAVARAADRFTSQMALQDRHRAITFAELADDVRRRGSGMIALGVGIGDRVVLAGLNSVDLVEAWLATIHAGALPVAVNPAQPPDEARHIMEDVEPALVLTGPGADGVALAAIGRGTRHASIDEVTMSGGVTPHDADPLEPAAIVYTSGTTSRPKGVLVRHAAYTETGRAFPSWLGLGPDTRLWMCLPFFHINAQAYTLMTGLMHGYPVAISERFHASSFWSDAKTLDVTHVNVVGAMLNFLEKQPGSVWTESRLRTIYAAPAPPSDRWRAFEKRFRVRIATGFGMTENTFGTVETATSRYKDSAIGAPRQPVDDGFVNDARVVAPDGRVARMAEQGELQFRNPVMTPGYWRAPAATASVIVDGWLHTGDAAIRDADGDLVLVGRYKDMIRRRGENIAPAEIEAVLLDHPAVRQAAAFGVPSADGEEDVAAAIVLEEGASADEEELRAFVRARLAAHKVPGAIRFYPDLPMTPTARVDKPAVRRRFLMPS